MAGKIEPSRKGAFLCRFQIVKCLNAHVSFRKRKRRARAALSLMLAIIVFPSALLADLKAAAQNESNSRSRPLAESQGLSLPIAVEIALRTNPLIRATVSGREMADAQLDEARASKMPFLQFSETIARSNNPVFVFGSLLEQGRFGPENFDLDRLNNPGGLNNFRTAFSFRLPIFDQKQSDTRINRARIGREQADSKKASVEQQVRFEVLRAYYGVLVAEAKRQVAEEAVRMAEADVKRIRDMFETGVVVKSDLLAAEVQMAEFLQQQIQTEGDIITARAALNTSLGVRIDSPQTVTGQLVEKSFDSGSQEELIRIALSNRPDFNRAGFALKSSKETTRGAINEWLPRLELFGAMGVSSNGATRASSDYTVGASVTFNIFDAGRKARINQARAAEAMAAAEQERLANQIRFEVVRAYQQYVSARERVKVAARVVGQAQEALRIVKDRYNEGLTTITEALRAETTFVRAQMSLLAARYDHYVFYAGVLMATGKLTDVKPFVG